MTADPLSAFAARVDEIQQHGGFTTNANRNWFCSQPSRAVVLALCDVAKAAQELVTCDIADTIHKGRALTGAVDALNAALASPESTPEQEERR